MSSSVLRVIIVLLAVSCSLSSEGIPPKRKMNTTTVIPGNEESVMPSDAVEAIPTLDPLNNNATVQHDKENSISITKKVNSEDFKVKSMRIISVFLFLVLCCTCAILGFFFMVYSTYHDFLNYTYDDDYS